MDASLSRRVGRVMGHIRVSLELNTDKFDKFFKRVTSAEKWADLEKEDQILIRTAESRDLKLR